MNDKLRIIAEEKAARQILRPLNTRENCEG